MYVNMKNKSKRDINDSLSNAVGPISISFKMADFLPWSISEILKLLIFESSEI